MQVSSESLWSEKAGQHGSTVLQWLQKLRNAARQDVSSESRWPAKSLDA